MRARAQRCAGRLLRCLRVVTAWYNAAHRWSTCRHWTHSLWLCAHPWHCCGMHPVPPHCGPSVATHQVSPRGTPDGCTAIWAVATLGPLRGPAWLCAELAGSAGRCLRLQSCCEPALRPSALPGPRCQLCSACALTRTTVQRGPLVRCIRGPASARVQPARGDSWPAPGSTGWPPASARHWVATSSAVGQDGPLHWECYGILYTRSVYGQWWCSAHHCLPALATPLAGPGPASGAQRAGTCGATALLCP